MNTDDYLQRYILQNIVERVQVNQRTRTLMVDQTKLTDQQLDTLLRECAKYGLSEAEARSRILTMGQNIHIYSQPSVRQSASPLSVAGIEVGRHLILCFQDKPGNEFKLALICVEKGCFAVVESEIPGVAVLDVLEALQPCWQAGSMLSFKVFRNGQPFPNEQQELQLEGYRHYKELLPGFLYEVYDTKQSFDYNDAQADMQANKTKYVDSWELHQVSGRPVFYTTSDDVQQRNSVFRIEPHVAADTATLIPNLDRLDNFRGAELINQAKNMFGNCCRIMIPATQSPEWAVCHSPGMLLCNDLAVSRAEWVLMSHPIIELQ